jgi:hypothetical protein
MLSKYGQSMSLWLEVGQPAHFAATKQPDQGKHHQAYSTAAMPKASNEE